MLLRPAALVLSGLVLTACGEPGAVDLPLRTETVELFPGEPDRREIGALSYRGGLVLEAQTGRFGGWSAVEITPDGERLLAVSDSASWMTARLVYDRDGELAGVSEARLAPMLGVDGEVLTGAHADAEGLAPLGGGRYAVSFERDHRILVYEIGADWSGIETAIPTRYNTPPGLNRLRENGGIEALAPAETGLWAAVEYPIVEGQPHTIWHVTQDDAVAHSVRLTDGFGLTGLARAGEDELIVIQRFWSRQAGNRIRISRLGESELSLSGAFSAEQGIDLIAEIGPEMTVDNIEGAAIAVIAGEPRLFLMSDDNFNPDQRTLLLSFGFSEAE